jgi:hypothetical protein
MNGSVAISTSRPVAIDARPYHTVSQSEDGLEKIMQSVTITLAWGVAAGSHETTITLEVQGGMDDKLLQDQPSQAGVTAD